MFNALYTVCQAIWLLALFECKNKHWIILCIQRFKKWPQMYFFFYC